MDLHTLVTLIVAGGGVFAVVWVLQKVDKAIAAILEALAAVAMVFLALWLIVKAAWWLLLAAVRHWRTTLALGVIGAWLVWWGWLSLVLTVGSVVAGLTGWRLRDRASFDPWVGRYVRSWWQRWTVYARRLPTWLHAGVDHP